MFDSSVSVDYLNKDNHHTQSWFLQGRVQTHKTRCDGLCICVLFNIFECMFVPKTSEKMTFAKDIMHIKRETFLRHSVK